MSDRIATALERIADALERAHPKFNPGGYIEPTWLYDGGVLPVVSVDARDLATGDPVPVSVEVRRVDRIGATLPDPNRCEPGCTRPSLHDGDCDNHRDTGLSAAWDACEVADGYLGGSGAARPKLIVSTASDPLDESDHRPRHFVDGGGDVIGTHLYRHGNRHWHSYPVEYLPCNQGCRLALTKWADIPLTFCDCDPTDSDRATD